MTVQTPLFDSMVEAMAMPRFVRLRPNLHAVVFNLMKILPAQYIIEEARATGSLTPGTPVLETSSGTFALGLAMVCRRWGHPLTIVGDPAIDPALRTRLELLGTRVEIVDGFDAPGGIQGARLARLEELRRERPDSFVPGQYDNPGNPASYLPVAEMIARTLGPVDRLVAPVGSGGSSGGIANALRVLDRDLELVAVDTPGSVIFGLPDAPRALRGLGNSLMPGNVSHTSYDEVHWVGAAEAFHSTRSLFADHGMFVGPTSGAAFLAADWHARCSPDETTVVVFPDDGYRYQDTVYSESWLRERGFWGTEPPGEPRTATGPVEVDPHWSRMRWNRRPAAEHALAR
ncbi:pyridoxal-phosphate dependent enzyme [Nocardiopsis lambiniae]|uniref:Pyridoxal-phosphate dependent enzyme n=1 Tax=Nocardiopsis lambiniae TaxID=3075539 RepID=A0ABU2M783_9ACTN|nr:pyridoxal-phosphate dependent enzyme [Nocardiopsis sp. DSM 44743]MDT0328091.1 pyridoxal-phosphate dependent enzyme [Nocardiopsis sp. DSM 44743]